MDSYFTRNEESQHLYLKEKKRENPSASSKICSPKQCNRISLHSKKEINSRLITRNSSPFNALDLEGYLVWAIN